MWTCCCSQVTPWSSTVRPFMLKAQPNMVTAVQLLLRRLGQHKQPACIQSTDAPIAIEMFSDSPARLGHCSAAIFALLWVSQGSQHSVTAWPNMVTAAQPCLFHRGPAKAASMYSTVPLKGNTSPA